MASVPPQHPKKAKVTLSIDHELWRQFLVKLIYERGKQKEASKVIESLVRKYLEGEIGGK